MCGIIGYIGEKRAQPILLNCLGKLEYRGYDSCGIAIAGEGIEVYKDAVRVKALARALPPREGTAGIGHTRWATHGEPSRVNAHPQGDCPGRIAVVHNGVINNFQKLREQLAAAAGASLGEVLAIGEGGSVVPVYYEAPAFGKGGGGGGVPVESGTLEFPAQITLTYILK